MNIPKIGQTLQRKRRELGLTQEDIAKQFGVSKASVSKWETGQSFPDTLLIPQLASFFNISIDQLFDYTPELSTSDISLLYENFGKRYLKGNDDHLLQEIEELITKYYAYPQFILAMSQWFLNYGLMEKDIPKKTDMLNRAYTLAKHATSISNTSSFLSISEMISAMTLLYQQKYQTCFEILGDEAKTITDSITNNILAQLYTSLGNKEKAAEIIKINLLQSITIILDSLVNYQSINIENKTLHDTIYQQVNTLISTFYLKEILSNSTLGTHLVASQSSIFHQQYQEAIARLQNYYHQIASVQFPITSKLNSYYEGVEKWMNENSYISNTTPITQDQVRSNLCNAILENPIFDVLKEYKDYQILIKQLEEFKNG